MANLRRIGTTQIDGKDIEIYSLPELDYAKPGPGPWALYVYDRDGFHRGKKWFRKVLQYPKEEITREAAKREVDCALAQGLEVRITDGGDRLVFHAKGIKQLYPKDAQDFWRFVGLQLIAFSQSFGDNHYQRKAMIQSLEEFHFEEDGHKYIQGGKSHPSVTGLLKNYGLIDYSMVAPEVLNKKRDQGVALHAWTERYDRDGNDDMLALPEEAIGYAEAWMTFRRQSGFELIKIEKRMMTSIMGVTIGGTPDREMRIKRTKDLVLDLKFCAAKMPAWSVQTAAYAMMSTGKTHIEHIERCSCQLFPDGRFKIHWYDKQSDADTFMSIVALEAWKKNQNMKGTQ